MALTCHPLILDYHFDDQENDRLLETLREMEQHLLNISDVTSKRQATQTTETTCGTPMDACWPHFASPQPEEVANPYHSSSSSDAASSVDFEIGSAGSGQEDSQKDVPPRQDE
eukprot:m.130397 g.130397  ORF g.130397 m.130397 type:complete len:113 (+) comp38026_c0_seq1:214-552(+)